MGYDYGVPMADNEALHIHLILQMYWDIVWKTVRNRMPFFKGYLLYGLSSRLK